MTTNNKIGTIEFNPYYKLDKLPLKNGDTCLSIMKYAFPYFKRQSSIGSFDSMLSSIITYVKKSHLPESQLESELDYIVDAFCTPFESSDTVIMFIDSKGKLMTVNNAFQKVYKYNTKQVINQYVGKFTQTVWFDKFLNNPNNYEAPKYFPGNHMNKIKRLNQSPGVIEGNTWPLIDLNGVFYGAISVHKQLCG